MRTDVDARKLGFLGDCALEVDTAGDGAGRVVEHDHERVADLFDHPTSGAVNAGPHNVLEAVHDLGGDRIAHHQRQGREVDQIDEHHGADHLPADVRGR